MECCFCNGEEPDPLEKWLLGQKAYNESLLQAAVDSRTTLPDIFCSHPKNKQSLVDIVADTVNQSSHTNLSARKPDGDADTMIVTTAVELASSGENVVILADDSRIVTFSSSALRSPKQTTCS